MHKKYYEKQKNILLLAMIVPIKNGFKYTGVYV